MKLTEKRLNKLLKDLWNSVEEFPTPKQYEVVKLGAGFMNRRKGRYYRVIKKEYERVYKKYNFQPKPKKAVQ